MLIGFLIIYIPLLLISWESLTAPEDYSIRLALFFLAPPEEFFPVDILIGSDSKLIYFLLGALLIVLLLLLF